MSVPSAVAFECRRIGRPGAQAQLQLLFAHCTSMVKECWRPVYDHLDSELDAHGVAADCIALDFSLHGDTGRNNLASKGSLTWIQFCPRDIFGVLERTRDPAVPLVGVGHSMGGAGLAFAELERPGTFEHLILYEPILRPPGPQIEWPGGVSPMVSGTLKRRRQWTSRKEARAYLSTRGFYKTLDPRVLDAFVAHGISDEFTLKCTPEDEARCYSNDGASEGSVWDQLSNVGAKRVDVWAGGDSRHLLGLSTRYSTIEKIVADMAAAFPQLPATKTTHRIFNRKSHFAPIDSPEWFAREVASAILSSSRSCKL